MKKIIFVLFFLAVFTASGVLGAPNNTEAIRAYNEGIEFYGMDQYEKSIDSFKKAVSIQPDFYEAYYNLGQVYLSINNIDEAIKNYELAVKYEPNDYDSCFMLGELLYKKGYLNRSMGYYARIPESSELYQEAQELKEKVQKRQKEVLEEIKKKQEEASLLKIQKQQEEALKLAEKNQEQSIKIIEKPQEISKPIVKEIAAPQNIEGISAPSGVIGDTKGNIFVASYGENRVYKINSQGQKSVYVTENVLKGPIGLAIDKNDNVYIANYGKGNVLKVTPLGAPYIFTKVLKPYCVAVIGDYLYISEQETNKVLKIKL